MIARPLSRVAAAIVGLPLLASCATMGVLDPAGPVAAGERTILVNSLGIMLAIVVPTIVLTLAFAWWFRAGNERAVHKPDWSYSGKLELLVWSIPLLVIIFLGGIAWIGSHDLDPPRPLASHQAPLRVQVIAMDWKWLFIYPEQGIATINRLVVPVGRPVAFEITSATVMNSFFIPQLGSQIYAMAGMKAKLNLAADRLGRFEGLSAHYSGAGFADMRFVVDSVRPAQFTAFVANARRAGPVLDGPAYLKLGIVQGSNLPGTYRAVYPGLFNAAVRQAGLPVHEVTHHAGREE